MRATVVRGVSIVVMLSITFGAACNGSPCPPLSPLRTPLPSPRPPEVAPIGHGGICDTTPDLPQCRRHEDPLEPRCLPSDPACGPQFVDGFDPVDRRIGMGPRWRGPHGESGRICLRPDAPRYPVAPRGLGRRAVVDACTSDGECRAILCSSVCANYRRPDPLCTTPEVAQERSPPPPADASPPPLTWCGCVAGRCTMFTQ
jgi:hypothetical protein